MKAYFKAHLDGLEQRGGIYGTLKRCAEASTGLHIFSGESLAAIRAAQGVTLSPAGRTAQRLAKAAAAAALGAARAQMHDIFDELPNLTRAGLLPEFSAINDALDRGDITAAYLRVSGVERPEGSEMSEEEFTTRKLQMLALFPTP